MSQVKGQVIRQRQDRKCPWAAILITKISVADNRLGISSQCSKVPVPGPGLIPVRGVDWLPDSRETVLSVSL